MPDIRVPPPPITTDDKGVWSAWYLRIKDAINQLRDNLAWTSLNFAGSNLIDVEIRNHNDLQNIQGGTTSQFYHLTLAQHTDLTDGGATTLHKHGHNSQDGLQGGTTNEYYHLTLDEYEDLFGVGGGGGGNGQNHGHADSYGEIYITNGSVSVTVSATDTAYEVSSGFTEGTSSSDVTFPSTHYLAVGTAGTYILNWSMSIDTTTAADQIEGGVMINGTAQSNATAHTTVSAGNAASNISASGVVTLAVADQVSLFIRNHTAARNIVVEHASLTILKLT